MARGRKMKRVFGRGRYADVTSTMALVVALGGTAYAANTVRSRDIVNGQVKRVDLANSAVTSGKVKDGSLLAGDFKSGQLPAGARGAAGAKGDAGAAGAKGDKGDPCPATEAACRGPQGAIGPAGPRGLKGEKGDPGVSGLETVYVKTPMDSTAYKSEVAFCPLASNPSLRGPMSSPIAPPTTHRCTSWG